MVRSPAIAPDTRLFMNSSSKRYTAEFLGTLFLLATVVGSGIMAEKLAGGNIAIALLGNTIPTGAILVVLITALGPVSGAHFNPVVTLVFTLKGELAKGDALIYSTVQLAGGVVGTVLAQMMFELPLIDFSEKIRSGTGQWVSEGVATFGLVFVILSVLHSRKEAVALSVGLYITAAYWFTASTSFANPAVTIARSFTNTFAGISPVDVPYFIIVQIAGALCALVVCSALFSNATSGTSDE